MRIDKPISEKEAEGSGFTPWRPGDYDFEVNACSEERSSTGNDMLKLTIYVFNEEGNKRTVFDYLVNSEKAQFKIRHFAASVGLIENYERGELDPYDIEGKTGRLKLRIKPAQGDYPAGNSVGDYIPIGDLPEKASRPAPRPAARPATEPHRPPTHNGGRAPTAAQRATADLDDEIPF